MRILRQAPERSRGVQPLDRDYGQQLDRDHAGFLQKKSTKNAENVAACHCGFAASPPSYKCCRIPWFACQEQTKTVLSCDASRGRSLNVRCGGVGANHCRNIMFSDASPIHKSATSGRNASLSSRSIIGKKYEGFSNAMCKVAFERGIATSLRRYIRHFRTSNLNTC